ncbi:MAG: hypothetical protein N3E52_05710 [Candidatus Bathyarchaeota archaeon]|nr:hypothetical protein [Candidatus Bathyarchaeota archaeon]
MKLKTITAIAAVLLLFSLVTAHFSIALVRADTGYDWNYGAASQLYASKWQQRNEDIDQINYALPQIYNLFAQEAAAYGHLFEFRTNWGWNVMRGLIQDSENDQYHDWATVFYYGHMGMTQIPGTPYYHYAFHEAGEQTAPEPSLIWDKNIYGYTGDNHNFVFLWVCRNGDTTGDDEPVPHGMSYCWFRRNLAQNGYSYPDAGTDCFIGFTGASPCLADGMGTYTYPYGENIYRFWLVFFYYFALNGYSIKGALDMASYMVGYYGYWLDPNNRLSQGWNYYFPGWQGPGNPPPGWPANGTYWGKMVIYGNGNIYLRQG